MSVPAASPAISSRLPPEPPPDVASLVDAFYAAANDAQRTSIADLHHHLTALHSLLTASPPALSSFLTRHYVSFSLFLLTSFNVDWLPAFSPSQRPAFDALFNPPIPASHVLLALAAALRSPLPSSRSAQAAQTSVLLSLLIAYVDQQRIRNLITEIDPPASSPTLPARGQSCIDALVSLPSLLSNRLQREVPPTLTAASFYAIALHHTAPLLSAPTPPLGALAALVSKLARVGQAPQVMEVLMPVVVATVPSPASDEEEDDWQIPSSPPLVAFAALLHSVSPATLETVLEAAIRHLGRLCHDGLPQALAERTLCALLAPALLTAPASHASTLIRHAVTGKLLHGRMQGSGARVLVGALFRLSYPPLSAPPVTVPLRPFFDEALAALARLWAQPSFLQRTAPAVQTAVTASLRAALTLLGGRQHAHLLEESRAYRDWVGHGGKPKGVDDSGPLGIYGGQPYLVPVMEGVQLRMGELTPERRKEGLVVAVAMSRLLDPTHPLDFDVSDDETDGADGQEGAEVAKRRVAPCASTASPPAPPSLPPAPSTTAPSSEVELDPDAPWTADSRLDSAWGSAASPAPAPPTHTAYVPYDLREDRSDLRKVPLPFYLRDVLDLLRKQEEREPIEAALEAVDGLIRSHPHDLPDLAAELSAALQQVATTVHCEDRQLDGRRRRALVSLVVEAPKQVVGSLVRSLYGQSLTLQGRMEVLDVLCLAAEELSGRPSPSQPSSSPSPTPTLAPAPSPFALQGREAALLTRELHAEVVTRRVEGRTRRWGRASRPPPTAVVNRFAPVAHLFVFPLLGGVQALVGGEAVLLARVLGGIAVMVGLAGGAGELEGMVGQWLQVGLAVRWHVSRAVRAEVLQGVLRLVVGVHRGVLEGVGEELREMREWVGEVEGDEGMGEDGRMLAVVCRVEMDKRLQGMRQWQGGGGGDGKGGQLQLVIPNAASLTSPSSLPSASSLIKFM